MTGENSEPDTEKMDGPLEEWEYTYEAVEHAQGTVEDILGAIDGGFEEDPRPIAVDAAYYQGILTAMEWAYGEKTQDDLMDTSKLEQYKPDDAEE